MFIHQFLKPIHDPDAHLICSVCLSEFIPRALKKHQLVHRFGEAYHSKKANETVRINQSFLYKETTPEKCGFFHKKPDAVLHEAAHRLHRMGKRVAEEIICILRLYRDRSEVQTM